MIEILVNTQAVLDIIFSAGYADGVVTTTVKDVTGATISTGAATKDNSVVGRYTYTLPPQSALMWLTVTWSGAFGGVTQSISTGGGQPDGTPAEVQVAGGHVFTVAQARAFADGVLSDANKYPDEMLIDARSRVTMLFEDFCEVSFVPRYGQATMDGDMTQTLWLPNTKINNLRSVSITGVVLSAGDIALIKVYPEGKLYRIALWPDGVNMQNIIVGYEHGYLNTPEDIAYAAMTYVYSQFTTSTLADRFISMQNDLGIIRRSEPDAATRPTGIPEVDATLVRYSVAQPVIA